MGFLPVPSGLQPHRGIGEELWDGRPNPVQPGPALLGRHILPCGPSRPANADGGAGRQELRAVRGGARERTQVRRERQDTFGGVQHGRQMHIAGVQGGMRQGAREVWRPFHLHGGARRARWIQARVLADGHALRGVRAQDGGVHPRMGARHGRDQVRAGESDASDEGEERARRSRRT